MSLAFKDVKRRLLGVYLVNADIHKNKQNLTFPDFQWLAACFRDSGFQTETAFLNTSMDLKRNNNYFQD